MAREVSPFLSGLAKPSLQFENTGGAVLPIVTPVASDHTREVVRGIESKAFCPHPLKAPLTHPAENHVCVSISCVALEGFCY